MKITGIILAKNEEENIERCIKSLNFCDEVVVVDDFSNDATVEIAHRNKAKVYKNKVDNDFSKQRNFALEKAGSEWVIFLDADEEISKELSEEITQAINTKYFDGYNLRRKDLAFGNWLRFGETSNVNLLRLGRVKSGKWERPVHESWKISGRVGDLKHPILHYSHKDILSSLKKINYYTNIEASFRVSKGEKSSLFNIAVFPIGKFIKNFILEFGFLDGMPGFLMAGLMSAHSFLVRVKVWERNNRVLEKYY